MGLFSFDGHRWFEAEDPFAADDSDSDGGPPHEDANTTGETATTTPQPQPQTAHDRPTTPQ